MAVKSQAELLTKLTEAKQLVTVGDRYSHYKNPDKYYQVVDVAIQEATHKVCVIYRAEYAPFLTFVRDLDIWLEEVEVDGRLVKRFQHE